MKTILGAAAIAAMAQSAMLVPAQAQDAAAGEQVAKQCLACHRVGEGAKNMVGPQLNGLDGRKAGSAPDFNYSDPMKASGLTWNEATFKDYIKDPRAKVPGTKMIFPGIKDDKKMADLWVYLASFGPDGKKK